MNTVAFVLKGYPRLSETFIAQEVLALEQRGLDIRLFSLRHPTDGDTHPIHADIQAPVTYLPEYLYQEPLRVLRGWWYARRRPGYSKAFRVWLGDIRRDATSNRIRRFGQAMVLARELPPKANWIHAHFLHTPASVARYAATILGLPWSCSAHAKDIWTSPEWEIAEKLADCRWVTTCTRVNADHLAAHLTGVAAAADRVMLAYHGLDLSRFTAPEEGHADRDGSDDPVIILSVGRAVEKKGYPGLLDALSRLPPDLAWRFVHIGGGPLLAGLKKQAEQAGLSDRIAWLGPQPQDEVLRQYRRADLFVLNCRIAADGDRDGLPNVLMEAQACALPCLSTRVSAVPELIDDGETGLLVAVDDCAALTAALERLIGDSDLRRRLGRAGMMRTRSQFSLDRGIDKLAARFGLEAKDGA